MNIRAGKNFSLLIFQLEGDAMKQNINPFFTQPDVNKNTINVKQHKLGEKVETLKSCVHCCYEILWVFKDLSESIFCFD